MGLAHWFTTFCTNIQVRNRETISNRYKTITRRLNTDSGQRPRTPHTVFTSSYGRKTATHGTSDVDMELPYAVYERYDGYHGNVRSPSRCPCGGKTTYPATDIGADGQVILVSPATPFELVQAITATETATTVSDSKQVEEVRQTRGFARSIRARNSMLTPSLTAAVAWPFIFTTCVATQGQAGAGKRPMGFAPPATRRDLRSRRNKSGGISLAPLSQRTSPRSRRGA